MTLHYNDYKSYLFVNGTEIFIFKADNINVNFLIQFCLGSISGEFDSNDSNSLLKNMYMIFQLITVPLINRKN